MINTFNIEYILLILIYIYLVFFINININTKILFTIILILLLSNKILKKYKFIEKYSNISKLLKNNNKNYNEYLEYVYDGDDENDIYLKNYKDYKNKLEIYDENFEDEENLIEEEYNKIIDKIEDEIDILEEEEEQDLIDIEEFDQNNIKYENYNINDYEFNDYDPVWVIIKDMNPQHAYITKYGDEYEVVYTELYNENGSIKNSEKVTSNMLIFPRYNRKIKISKNLEVLHELKDELFSVNKKMNEKLDKLERNYNENVLKETQLYDRHKNKNTKNRLYNKMTGFNKLYKNNKQIRNEINREIEKFDMNN